MVKSYEIHVITPKDLSEIEKYMQDNKLQYSKKLVKEGIVYNIIRNNKILKVMIELYNETNDEIEYEFKVNSFEDLQFINSIVKEL